MCLVQCTLPVSHLLNVARSVAGSARQTEADSPRFATTLRARLPEAQKGWRAPGAACACG
eukprot:5453702-Prymnesium_polylepis.1